MNLDKCSHIATIPGLENYSGYYINEEGEVYSSRSKRIIKMKPSFRNPEDRSYLRVGLSSSNYKTKKSFSVHQLVALAFKYTPNWRSLTVDHIDECKQNNKASNLQWLTGAANTAKGQLKRRKFSKEQIQVITNEYLNTNSTLEDLALKYKVTLETMWRVVNKMSGQFNHKKRNIFNISQKKVIYQLYKAGKLRSEIAKLYNCSLSHICNICNELSKFNELI